MTSIRSKLAIVANVGVQIDSGAPSTTTNVLYNVGGVLYFNGVAVSANASYSATIGDGTSTSIVVTHNLNTTNVDVSIFELSGNKRKVDPGVEIRNTSVNSITLVFSVAPASNSLQVNVFAKGASISGPTRSTSTYTSASLAAAATETGTITLPRSCELYKISVSYPARIRLYHSDAYRTADASRAVGVIPAGDHGMFSEIVAPAGSSYTFPILPIHDFIALDDVSTTAYISITNLDTVSRVIAVTYSIMSKE